LILTKICSPKCCQTRRAHLSCASAAGILRDLYAFSWVRVYTGLKLWSTLAPRPPLSHSASPGPLATLGMLREGQCANLWALC